MDSDAAGGPTFFAFSMVNVLSAVAVLILRRRENILEPVKLFVILYTAAFAVLPMWLGRAGAYDHPYFAGVRDALLDAGAALSLAGLYLSLTSWWFVTYVGRPVIVFPRGPNVSPEHVKAHRTLLTGVSILLLIVGAWSYVLLVRGSGGLNHFMTYTGARSEIFSAFGGYYWGMFFLITFLCLFGAVHIEQRPKSVAALAVACFAAFALFQGRDLALAPLFCGLVLYHYRIKPLGLKKILLVALCGITLASLIREYRTTDKEEIHEDRAQFGREYFSEYSSNLERTLGSAVEHLDSFMVALRYIDLGNEPTRGATLFSWLNPLLRIADHPGGTFPDAGQILDYAANPVHRGFPTAITPSLKGELVLNFGIVGMLLGMLLYGAVLGVLQLISERAAMGSDLSLAVLPYVLWIIVKVPIDGSHLFFKMTVVTTPLVLAWMVARLLRMFKVASLPLSSPPAQNDLAG